MTPSLSHLLLCLSAVLPLAHASPAVATVTAPPGPTPVRRDIVSSVESKFSSATGAAASALPSAFLYSDGVTSCAVS